jgi:hypothetical protein
MTVHLPIIAIALGAILGNLLREFSQELGVDISGHVLAAAKSEASTAGQSER